jgi:hypothetical protein
MPSSIEAGLGAIGAACADIANARPTADARIKVRISVSAKENSARHYWLVAANKS